MNHRDGVILQLYSRARAPNRDYYGLTLTTEEAILNIWNITHGPHVFPKKQRCPLGDLQIAKPFIADVFRLFGEHVVDYALALGRGEARLDCLPTKAFLKILRCLATNDILRLGQTSKIFFELCNRNDAWGIVFAKRNKARASRDEIKVANAKGWRIVLKNKLVWAERLQRISNSKAAKTGVNSIKDKEKRKELPPKRISSASALAVKTSTVNNPRMDSSFNTQKKIAAQIPELEKLRISSTNPTGKVGVQTDLDSLLKLGNIPDSKHRTIFTNRNIITPECLNTNQTISNSFASTSKLNMRVSELEKLRQESAAHMQKIAQAAKTLPKANITPPLFSHTAASLNGLPIKGILKNKTSDLLASRTTSKLETVPEVRESVSLINYTPMAKSELISVGSTKLTAPAYNSLISSVQEELERKGVPKSAKERQMENFLVGLEERVERQKHNPHPFKNTGQQVEEAGAIPKVPQKIPKRPMSKSTSKLLSKSDKLLNSMRDLNIDEAVGAPTKTQPEDDFHEGMLTSKFEDYLNKLKGKSVVPDAKVTRKKLESTPILSKTDIMPKISELGKSINAIRGSFYGTSHLKMKMNLNNSKIDNQNGQVQQPNNKINSIASTSAIETKRNVIKNNIKAAAPSASKAKAKDTNLTANKKNVKTTSAALTAKKLINTNLKTK